MMEYSDMRCLQLMYQRYHIVTNQHLDYWADVVA